MLFVEKMLDLLWCPSKVSPVYYNKCQWPLILVVSVVSPQIHRTVGCQWFGPMSKLNYLDALKLLNTLQGS